MNSACISRRGFSLIELLVAIGLMAVIGFAVVGSYRAIETAKAASEAGTALSGALREAQNRARVMEYDGPWGVRVGSSTLTVFSGSSYAARTASRDRDFRISNRLTIGGTLEVTFAKFTALPSVVGTTTFNGGATTTSVFWNAEGAVGITP